MLLWEDGGMLGRSSRWCVVLRSGRLCLRVRGLCHRFCSGSRQGSRWFGDLGVGLTGRMRVVGLGGVVGRAQLEDSCKPELQEEADIAATA